MLRYRRALSGLSHQLSRGNNVAVKELDSKATRIHDRYHCSRACVVALGDLFAHASVTL